MPRLIKRYGSRKLYDTTESRYVSLDEVAGFVRTGDEVELDTKAGTFTNVTTGESWALQPLGDVAAILEAGGVFEYARQQGLIPA